MSATFEISTYEEIAGQLLSDVFASLLSYPVVPSFDSSYDRSDLVSGAVFLVGSWNGAVVLTCSEQLARLLAARLTGMDEPATFDEDARDALGELANIVGGNLKSVLPSGVSLSLPSVFEGSDQKYKICRAGLTVRLAFSGEAGPLWLTLAQMIEPNNNN